MSVPGIKRSASVGDPDDSGDRLWPSLGSPKLGLPVRGSNRGGSPSSGLNPEFNMGYGSNCDGLNLFGGLLDAFACGRDCGSAKA